MQRLSLRSGDSPSLWNQTLSPGWSQEETEILRLAIMKFGVGRWKSISESCCLPGKTPAQLNLQTQRMFGQQSLSVLNGIHLDPKIVFEDNALIKDVRRKNGLIIRSGNKLSKEEKIVAVKENKEKYAISKEEIDSIILPDRSKEFLKLELLSREAKEKRIEYLKERLNRMEERLQTLVTDEDQEKTISTETEKANSTDTVMKNENEDQKGEHDEEKLTRKNKKQRIPEEENQEEKEKEEKEKEEGRKDGIENQQEDGKNFDKYVAPSFGKNKRKTRHS